MKNKKVILIPVMIISISLMISFLINIRLSDLSISDYEKREITTLASVDYTSFSRYTHGTSNDLYDNALNTFDKLLEASNHVIIGSFVDKKQEKSMFVTEVKVENSIKGDLIEDEVIKLFEPVHYEESMLMTNGLYIPIQEGKNYLLFLNLDSEYGEVGFNYISDIFGKFPADEKIKGLISENGELVPLKTLIKYDYLYVDNYEDILESVNSDLDGCDQKEDECKFYTESKKAIERYNTFQEDYSRIWNDYQAYMMISK